MSYLLSDPETVLLLGDESVDRIRTALVPSVAGDLLAVSDVESSVDVLSDRDDVGCVLVTDSTDPAAACRAVRETTDLVPVVVTVPVADCDHAALAALDDCRYVPPSAGEDALATVVGNALETYDERRRRAAESSLFTTFLADAELAVFAKDREGRHLYKSDIEDDVDPASVVGRTDLEITADYMREKARADFEDDMRVVETGVPIYDRVREYDHDGHTHWARTTKVPWRDDDGEVQGIVGYAEDITDQKRFERHLAEQSERIDQFITYVAHDLRTPLQIAYGHVDRARAGADDALNGIETSIHRIEDIVEDLARLSKRSGTEGLSSETLRSFRAESLTTEFVPLVENVWSVLSDGEADLTVDLPEDTVVAVDAKTLRPLFENLFKNALDHAGPNVSVRVGALDRGFFVEDDGPGIPDSERSKVTKSGYTTAEDGTGTGLDIVAETVEQHGWDLHITAASPAHDTPRNGPDGESPGARIEVAGVPMVTRTEFGVRERGRVPLDRNEDVGPVSVPGSAEYDRDADRWTVVADGSNVWGNTNEFHYVHGEAESPVRIQGRIVDLDGPHEFSKCGLAIRAGPDERAPFGYVGTTESHGSEVTWREGVDGFTDSDQFGELPGTFSYYRVEYVDGVVTLYLSESGDEWTPVDQQALDLGERVSVGLMVCGHSSKRTCEATFGDVRAVELEFV
ncbi:ATP-binding protein [Halosimplex salinum]|uniref:ATP-binding protein n=1 Tax=Halosimplex salinum TaxID=1710538 RepID=UPI0013DD9B93|nr:ATP-binding protein [Halosimplex salinum]